MLDISALPVQLQSILFTAVCLVAWELLKVVISASKGKLKDLIKRQGKHERSIITVNNKAKAAHRRIDNQARLMVLLNNNIKAISKETGVQVPKINGFLDSDEDSIDWTKKDDVDTIGEE